MDENTVEGKKRNIFEQVLEQYKSLLDTNPVLTKAVTSGVIAALGDVISQTLIARNSSPYMWRSTAAYATFGLLMNGPLVHYFYCLLDELVPTGKSPQSGIKRIILDRVIVTPPYLLLFFYVVAILEGHSSAVAWQKIKDNLWTAIKINWKLWTGFQYININYVPPKYRVLVTSMVSLVWTVVIATKRRHS